MRICVFELVLKEGLASGHSVLICDGITQEADDLIENDRRPDVLGLVHFFVSS
jgi:hypothetical protein